MKIAPLFLATLLLAVAAQALTVATYNVENYLVTDRMADGAFRQAYPKPENEKNALRQVIGAIAPDILALQEMGKPPFLAELQTDLKAEGHDYPHALVLEAADEARHVAFLSKVPFKDVREHKTVPVKFLRGTDVVKRGVLEVTVATDRGDLTLFVAHLKSRRTERLDDPEGAEQRLAEATAFRDLVLARFPKPQEAMFALLGDFNDSRNSKPLRALLKRGNTVVAEMLRAADSRGENWTHAYRREDSYSRIDFILVSPALKPHVATGVAKVYDGPGSREASDHRAVFMKLDLSAP
jgi:endonuclease/exonuclease/phosphatase family metal-dependent hydrolase